MKNRQKKQKNHDFFYVTTTAVFIYINWTPVFYINYMDSPWAPSMASSMDEPMVSSMDGSMDTLHGIVHGRTHGVVRGRLRGHPP